MPGKGENLAPETPPNKGISSRLLTMKFMQRAAASESAQSTPASSNASSTKRRKTDSPLTGDFHSFDEAAIQAAVKQQEATRQAALSKHKAELADTPWVLDGFGASDEHTTAAARRSRNIVYVGYSQIDASDDDQEDHREKAKDGRQRIGNHKTKTSEKPGKADASDGEGESDSSSDDDSEGDRGRKKNKASTPNSNGRKHNGPKQSAETSRARDFMDKRKKSEVNLNQLSSISGGFSTGGGTSSSSRPSFNCHTCGKQGHKAIECPSKRSRSNKRKSSG